MNLDQAITLQRILNSENDGFGQRRLMDRQHLFDAAIWQTSGKAVNRFCLLKRFNNQR